MVGSQPHIQWNNSEVCVGWALYPEAPPEPAAHASEDGEWELVPADAPSAGDSAARPAQQIRWLGGASVSVAAPTGSPLNTTPPLPTFLVTNEDAVRSMCVLLAAAIRHAPDKKPRSWLFGTALCALMRTRSWSQFLITPLLPRLQLVSALPFLPSPSQIQCPGQLTSLLTALRMFFFNRFQCNIFLTLLALVRV